MRILIVIMVALRATYACAQAKFDPFDGPKPLVVFIQSNPWAMVIGSDTPRVVLYENGDVVFAKMVNDQLTYHHATLGKPELEKVREQLKPVWALNDLKSHYDIRPNVTDQPEAMFYLRDGERVVVTTVYGLMAPGTKLPGYFTAPESQEASRPPDELIKLHKWLCELDYPHSKEWTPKYVEAMLWDYSYAPDASIQWPKDWPALDSERAIQRGRMYSIFLDGAQLPELRAFLASRNAKGAVEIGGKKMAAAYRFTFPSERAWREAFAKADEQAAKEEKPGKQSGG